jgi:glycosyltransferase involved in cell wall biosynthesis
LNIGLSVAKGEYIARMDVDDISITDRFERQVGFLENNLNYGLVGSNYYEINDFGKVIGEVLLPSSDLEIRNTIFKFNPYNHSSVIMRKNVIDRCGKYNEKYTMAQDYELWFRILAISKGRNLKEKLLLKRNPENSITKFRKKKQIYYSMLAWIRGRHYIDPKKIYYIYLIKLIFMYLIPSFAIPLLRRNFSREKQIRNGIYYSAKLEK